MQKIVSSAFQSLGAFTTTAGNPKQHPLQNSQSEQPIQFCKFSQIYAKDFLEIINTTRKTNTDQQLEYSQIQDQNDNSKWKQYFVEQLIKQNELYSDIIENHEDQQQKPSSQKQDQNLTTSSSDKSLQKQTDQLKNNLLSQNNQKVSCLLICTAFTFEIWVLNKQLSIKLKNDQEDLDCLWRKQERGVIYFDFLYVNTEPESTKQMHSKCQDQNVFGLEDNMELTINKNNKLVDNSSDDEMFGGASQGHLPIIGYVKACSPNYLTLYSLKNETAIHQWVFGAPVIKIQSNIKNPSNKAIVMLQNGYLQIINLKSMNTEISLPTFFIQTTLQKMEINYKLVLQNLPQHFDTCSNMYAYIHHQINQEDQILELQKSVESSVLGQNIYTREVAENVMQIGQVGYNKMVNYLNVQKAGSIDGAKLLQDKLTKSQKFSNNYQIMMMGAQQDQSDQQNLRIRETQIQAALDFETMQNENELFKDQDFVRKVDNQYMHNKLKNSMYGDKDNFKQQINDISGQQNKLNKENKVSILIRNIHTHQLFAEIEPPFFESISFIKFSPSGRLLLIANENSQYFYIYEIAPQTGLRVQGQGGPNNQSVGFQPPDNQERVRLQYYLFRGYTTAQVTDVQFVQISNCNSDLEQLIVINTSNSTSHIYNLNKNQGHNKAPVIKSADYDSGGNNFTKQTFFQQQLQQMKVTNVEDVLRVKYKRAAQEKEKEQDKNENEPYVATNNYTETNDTASGIGSIINKAATGAGILTQYPELNHLVSIIRQEWDPHTQNFQYQLQSYSSRNEYFIFDIGTNINQPKMEVQDQNLGMKKEKKIKQLGAMLTKPMFNLNVSINYFIPIFHQDQIIKSIQRCGEFKDPCQNSGARKKSSSLENSQTNAWLDLIENETNYPKILLEQRMNQNIHFRQASDTFLQMDGELNDFSHDFETQLNQLTSVSKSETERVTQKSQYYNQNLKLFEIQANRFDIQPEEQKQMKQQADGSLKMSSVMQPDHFKEPEIDYFAYDDRSGLLESQIMENPALKKKQDIINKVDMLMNKHYTDKKVPDKDEFDPSENLNQSQTKVNFRIQFSDSHF